MLFLYLLQYLIEINCSEDTKNKKSDYALFLTTNYGKIWRKKTYEYYMSKKNIRAQMEDIAAFKVKWYVPKYM